MFLHLVTEKNYENWKTFAFRKVNTMQSKDFASHCEPSFKYVKFIQKSSQHTILCYQRD